MPKPRKKKPVPLPRTIIDETNKALKGYIKSYEINKKKLLQISVNSNAEHKIRLLVNILKRY